MVISRKIFLCAIISSMGLFNMVLPSPLADAPEASTKVGEIMIEYSKSTPEYFNKLSPEEQVFMYYFWRACLPGNRIAIDQFHRNGLEVVQLFEDVLKQKEAILTSDGLYEIDTKKFIDDVTSFLIYLWTNHGQYFLRENGDEKRTPQRVGLTALTAQNLRKVLEHINYSNASVLDRLEPMIFDPAVDIKMTVPGDIAGSGVNIYASDFTKEDYCALPSDVQAKINAYFYVKQDQRGRTPAYQVYSTTGKYSEELSVAVHWLKHAHGHAAQYPQHFDIAFVKSLDYLVQYLESGDEELFKKHSIEWLKSNSRIDYCFGFIEVYHDPEGRRGFFQAEATVKTVDMKKLNELLPSLEKQMPIPAKWKREALGAMPNASMNQQMFGFGGLGPMRITAAYCLPNYADIRSEYGSKQIIYPADKSVEMRINPELAYKLFYPQEQADWLIKNDPEGVFNNDVRNVLTILHETLGHGSGRLGEHTFQEGEQLTIGGETHVVGQTIPVTDKNETEFLAGCFGSIEELRAEINALYISITHLDELGTCDLMNQWVSKFGKEKVVEWLILNMAGTGLRRIIQQSDSATEISGAHAHANSVIMNYLIDKGGMSVVEEKLVVNEQEYTVVGLNIDDLELTKKLIQELMVKVQAIKSTGDTLGAKNLVLTYGTKFRKPEYLKILKDNRKAIIGDLKSKALISPYFSPVYDKDGNVTAVDATWPNDIVEQFFQYRDLGLSTI